ncbi:MAG: hypothetical protein ACHP79_15000, partial [Terriglobales bacterium]
FWAHSLAALAICSVIAVVMAHSNRPRLLSEHAQPAVIAPSEIVAVSVEGNLFHAPGCKYLHGAVKTMPASEAIARGYTPCTRCMRRTLGKAGS